MDLLRERIDTETGQAIILKLIETMDAESASAIADECEDFVRYREYLSEDEAEDIVRKFVNFDGSRGDTGRIPMKRSRFFRISTSASRRMANTTDGLSSLS